MKFKHALLISSAMTLIAGVIWFSENTPIKKTSFESGISEEYAESEEIGPALEYLKLIRANPKTGTIEPEWVEAAVAQADRLSMLRRASLTWTNMGPDNIGGRCRALLLHKDSMNLWFMGGVSGGLFRSNTSGASWAPVNDKQENLNVTCIAQTADGIIYYGTGEGGFTNLSGTRNGSPAFIGNGLYKSTNASGTTFTRIANASDNRFYSCNAMAAFG
ncbi:MAG: WD40/YVTN/BNR-like repeat-containing protein, partial [Sphingomonadales bacterium]